MVDTQDQGPVADGPATAAELGRGARKLPWSKVFLGLVGMGLFIHLLYRVGLVNILDNVRRLGAWFLLLFGVEAGRMFAQACAWSVVHNSFFKKIPLLTLFRIKLISDSFNFALPSASLGGDAVRTLLVRKMVPLTDGIPSVVFDKTFELIGSTVYLTACFSLGLISAGRPRSLAAPLLIALGLTIAGIVLLVWAQVRGFRATFQGISRLIPKFNSWITSREKSIQEMDANFKLLYSKRGSRPVLAGLFHVLSRLVGTMEVLIVLAVLGAPVNFAQAMLISAVVTSVNTAFFFLPGQLGVMEGAHMMILRTLGYPPGIGLSLSVIRRIRRVAFVGLATILFVFERRKAPDET